MASRRDRLADADALIAHGVVALAPGERVVTVETLARALEAQGRAFEEEPESFDSYRAVAAFLFAALDAGDAE